MNDHEILKKIKQEATVHEPDLKDFIHRRFSKKQSSFFSWPTLSFATLLVALALIVVVVNQANINPSLSSSDGTLTSSSEFTSSNTSSNGMNPPLTLANREPLGIAAVSTTSLLPSLTNGNDPASKLSRPEALSESDFDQVLEDVSSYFPIVEQIISGQGALVITTYDVPNDDFYFGKFSYLDIIESTDLTGIQLVYRMYYNVLALNENIPLSEDNFRIRGLVIINEITYGLIGSKVTENEDIVFQFSSFLILGLDEIGFPIMDENNFVFSRYVYSDETTRYRIIRFEQGVAIQSTWMNIEIEDDEIKMVFELETDETSSVFQFKYEVENEDDEDEDEEVTYAKLDVRFRIEREGHHTLTGRIRMEILQNETNQFIYRLRVTEGDFKDKEKDEHRSTKGSSR